MKPGVAQLCSVPRAAPSNGPPYFSQRLRVFGDERYRPVSRDTPAPHPGAPILPIDVRMQPEKRLMVAVLADAVSTVVRHGSNGAHVSQKRVGEVEAWIAAEDDDWPFSFVNVCAALGLDASTACGPSIRTSTYLNRSRGRR